MYGTRRTAISVRLILHAPNRIVWRDVLWRIYADKSLDREVRGALGEVSVIVFRVSRELLGLGRGLGLGWFRWGLGKRVELEMAG